MPLDLEIQKVYNQCLVWLGPTLWQQYFIQSYHSEPDSTFIITTTWNRQSRLVPEAWTINLKIGLSWLIFLKWRQSWLYGHIWWYLRARQDIRNLLSMPVGHRCLHHLYFQNSSLPPRLSHGILSLVAWCTGSVLLTFYLIMAPTYHRYFIMTCVKRWAYLRSTTYEKQHEEFCEIIFCTSTFRM